MPEASQPPARNAFKTCPYPLEEPVGTEELDVDVHRLFESTLPSQLARTGQPVLSDGVSVGFDVNGIGRWQVVEVTISCSEIHSDANMIISDKFLHLRRRSFFDSTSRPPTLPPNYNVLQVPSSLSINCNSY